MTPVAFIYKDTIIYWSTIIIILASIAAMLAAVGMSLIQQSAKGAGEKGNPVFEMCLFIPLAAAAALAAGRFMHWYCCYSQYTNLQQAFRDFTGGSYYLPGAILGAVLIAVLLRLCGLCKNLPRLLDAAAPAAALGIAAGRFNAFFHSADRGKMVYEQASLQGLPFSTAFTDAAGNVTWRAAVFCWQGILCAALAVLLTSILLLRRKANKPHGFTALCFAVCYSAGEIALDSMRYDSAYLRSNGFVSLTQILALVVLVAVMTAAFIRRCRLQGFRARSLLYWVMFLAGTGLTGFMEYYVQRHGNLHVLSYALMTSGLLLTVLTILKTGSVKYVGRRSRKGASRPSTEETE